MKGWRSAIAVRPTTRSGGRSLAAGIAEALSQRQEWGKAEPYFRESLTYAARIWPDDLQLWESQRNCLVEVLQRQGKRNEVEQVRAQLRPQGSAATEPNRTEPARR